MSFGESVDPGGMELGSKEVRTLAGGTTLMMQLFFFFMLIGFYCSISFRWLFIISVNYKLALAKAFCQRLSNNAKGISI